MVGKPRPSNHGRRTGRNAHSILQQLLQFFFFLNIDLFLHPSKQQQELNNEIEILVSINAESKHFQRKPIRSIVVVVELYNVKFIITASLGSF